MEKTQTARQTEVRRVRRSDYRVKLWPASGADGKAIRFAVNAKNFAGEESSFMVKGRTLREVAARAHEELVKRGLYVDSCVGWVITKSNRNSKDRNLILNEKETAL